jgi:hypothetical protein
MNAIQTLYDFLDRAKKDRKYADNTVGGFKAALKLFEASLNEEEKQSLEVLQRNLNSIAEDVYTKNKDKFTSSTIMVYRRRVAGLIKDYKQYGDSPSKMAAWNPRRQSSSLKSKNNTSPTAVKVKRDAHNVQEAQIIDVAAAQQAITFAGSAHVQGGISVFDSQGRYSEINRSEVYLREGFKITLELPTDLSGKEATKLKQYIDLMVMD